MPQQIGPQVSFLSDRKRLHLQHGPIDLIIQAYGDPQSVERAYQSAINRFETVLSELVRELDQLRRPFDVESSQMVGLIAQRMGRAVENIVRSEACFVTPMIAVAGAVADEIMATMQNNATISKAYVNNGGDIAVCLGAGENFEVGLATIAGKAQLFGQVKIKSNDGIGGIASSGRHGRSLSLGIADSVTILAANAAIADVAATLIANAVDLPDHTAIIRVPASNLDPDSDLGDQLVVTDVGTLSAAEIDAALERGVEAAHKFVNMGHALAAALHLAGQTRVVGAEKLLSISRNFNGN